ncbi:hypothetical protein BC939DRAFT_299464 [Gamsiella multidivaricata]|uniref:uncharacterized protein n=1 Tax=Gamsiella multidivaricata TaxID=101098 RepID=UPI00221F68B1|nr:uncharacterized protein BC939DRAFT_299464 [Gamsiella multidivaricata]KAI7818140.1 hypothetical protein BC939DRAFT_299464 [Gamsiella multidivaricata]
MGASDLSFLTADTKNGFGSLVARLKIRHLRVFFLKQARFSRPEFSVELMGAAATWGQISVRTRRKAIASGMRRIAIVERRRGVLDVIATAAHAWVISRNMVRTLVAFLRKENCVWLWEKRVRVSAERALSGDEKGKGGGIQARNLYNRGGGHQKTTRTKLWRL